MPFGTVAFFNKPFLEVNLMIEKKDPQKTIERDKLLLDIMTHVYDEDERRNELVDTKNSQMILLSGTMLTLQSTLLSKIFIENILLNDALSDAICCKSILLLAMLGSIVGYFIAMIFFIYAYAFKNNFQMVPESGSVIEAKEDNDSENKIISEMLTEYNKSIKKNDELIEKKVHNGKIGFIFLVISGILTITFISLFMLILFVP